MGRGIHVAHNYLTTQLPFPYVHMITLLVNVNSVFIAVVAGAQCRAPLQLMQMEIAAAALLAT